ncbi:MAG TPA: hypothetical protein VF631_01590 [Allosphingosinicella sp.]|uniref:hypothetical protein n=1 Tax=Allosphingosinicella sp. TaxID=2823234 RepID=UPI002F287365
MKGSTSNQPFNPRLIAGLVCGGLLAFIGFLVLTAYAGNFRSGRDGLAHALSVSAVGYKGLADLIELSGGDTFLARDQEAGESEDLLIVTINERTEQSGLTELLERRSAKATLLVLPKWQVQAQPLRRSWVTKLGPAPASSVGNALPDWLELRIEQSPASRSPLAGQSFMEGFQVAAPSEIVQTVAGEGLEPLLAGPRGAAVLARLSDRNQLYILADPDLLNNQGLRERERAAAALALIDQLNVNYAESVIFDLTLSGFGEQQSMLRLAFEPPFLALTAALLIAGLLAALHGVASFGPRAHEKRAIALGKAALVDNSAGLVRLARREHRVGSHYADVVRDAAVRDAGAPANLNGAELETYLDRIGPPAAPRFSELASAVRAAGDPETLLGAARALFQWKKDMAR